MKNVINKINPPEINGFAKNKEAGVVLRFNIADCWTFKVRLSIEKQ